MIGMTMNPFAPEAPAAEQKPPRKHGPSKRYPVTIHAQIPDHLEEALQTQAARRDVDKSEVIRDWLTAGAEAAGYVFS